MNRRLFLKNSAVAGTGIITGANVLKDSPFNYLQTITPPSLMGQRFVTLCIMIRTTPWEVSRDVKLHPRDEEKWHTLEGVKNLREAFGINNPEGRLTWGFTLNALEDKRNNYAQIREYAAYCQAKY